MIALAGIGVEDEEVLGITAFRRAVLDGYAAHHAGILPLLKTVVEDLFARGLLKVVFATETLALGINMPARSVVLEKLVKFNGVEHADLTPGEFTQLTGRARATRDRHRGACAWSWAAPASTPAAVGSLASRRTYPLRSAFRPTPNMAVNLLDRFDLGRARETLETSFAQFQTDRSVVGLARQAPASSRTPWSPIATGRHLRSRRPAESMRRSRSRSPPGRRPSPRLVPPPIGTAPAPVLGVAASWRRDRAARRASAGATPSCWTWTAPCWAAPRSICWTPRARRRSLRPGDVPSAPAVIDSLRLPRQESMGSSKVRKDTAAALRQRLSGHDEDPRREVRARAERTPSTAATDPALQQLRAELAEHPCSECPDLASHLRWVGRWRKSRSELEGVQRRIRGRTSSLARQFDRLTDLLVELGYLERTGPTGAGAGPHGPRAPAAPTVQRP